MGLVTLTLVPGIWNFIIANLPSFIFHLMLAKMLNKCQTSPQFNVFTFLNRFSFSVSIHSML